MVFYYLALKLRLTGEGGKGAVTVLRRRLNDPNLIPRGSVRTYVYSTADELVEWRDVEVHAKEAEERGWGGGKVRMVKYQETGHVAHMMTDPEKYWGEVVQRTWEAGLKGEN